MNIHGGALVLNETGVLHLAKPLPLPKIYLLDIVVEDTREQCIIREPELGNIIHSAGPCRTTIQVTIQSVVFLDCPTDINALIPLSENTAELSWREPHLPAFVSNVDVNRDLGDTDSSSHPYVYTIGRRRITYRTTALAVGGPLECSFEIDVRHGYALIIDKVVSTKTVFAVQDFLVVDKDERPEGIALPSFNSSIGPRAVTIALRSPVTAPFTISPLVGYPSCDQIESPSMLMQIFITNSLIFFRSLSFYTGQ